MSAALVSEYKWMRTTNLQAMRTRRTHKPEPIKVEATCRTTHLTGCARIQGDVVATGTLDEMLDVEGWACDCVLAGAPEQFAPAADDDLRTVRTPASAKQVAFLRSLGAADSDVEDLDRKAASAMIDTLLAAPKPVAAPVTETDDRPHVPADVEILNKSNRYGGECVLCGGRVADGAGRLAKRAGKFVVAHNDGECTARTTTQPQVERTSRPLADVPAGHYAITSTGHNDLAFYRVDRPTEGTYAGRTFVKMIVGGHPDQNVRRDHVAGILDRIVEAGVEHSARLYGQEIGRCCRCNRTLTDEESRRNGIGPECASKGF